MCEGPLCVKRQQTLDVVSGGGGEKKMVEHGVSGFKRIGGYPTESYGGSLLLELSASDDVIGFKQAIEEDGSAIDESSSWYGRLTSGEKMGVSQRTPLMIAALYGSKEVIKYILSTYKTCGIDVNWASQTDGATALHCAAVGGSPSSAEIIKLLVDASADVNSLDMSGNRSGDVMCSSSPVLLGCIASLVSLLNVSGEGKSPTAKARSSPEKKEYPVDPSMPDIKNGLYSTDDFRMYTFKVKPCSRAYSHDWTECPFVHPGENARRRDPRRYHYSCVPCPDFRKGACRRGDACEYAHGVFECWLHPAQYRTRLCKDEINCTRRVCFFAHKHEELRSLYPSTGSALPSPRSSSPSAFDSGLMSPLAFNSTSVLMPTTPPMSPSANSASVWQFPLVNGLQGSRLKSALHARDLMADDLEELDEQQLQLLDDFAAVAAASSSPPLQQSRLNNLAAANMLAASAGSRSGKFRSMAGIRMPATNLDDIFASDFQSQMADISSGFDHQSLLSLEAATAAMAQLQSSTLPNMSYGMSLPPVRTSSPHAGIGSSSPLMSPALATAVLNNSRSAAFAKRSQSFIDRSSVPTVNIGSPASPSALSGWNSPTGKVDWGVQGEELNKLRKSASFAIRSSSSNSGFGGNNAVFANGEQDVSFVQSLVKDRGHRGSHGNGAFFAERAMKEYGGGGGIDSSSGFVPWVDQLYMEQEQMVG